MLAAGKFTERVTLQTPTITQAADGQPVESFANLVTVWAQVEELGGRETRRGEQIVSEFSHRVTIRYRAGVTSDMRLVWGSRTFEIDGAHDPEGFRYDLVLMCKETVV